MRTSFKVTENNLNAEVNQNVDRRTDGQTSSIHKPELLCNPAKKITERLKFQDFNICPNILHVDADEGADADTDADAGCIAIALLH